jgi:hypothetical protein
MVPNEKRCDARGYEQGTIIASRRAADIDGANREGAFDAISPPMKVLHFSGAAHGRHGVKKEDPSANQLSRSPALIEGPLVGGGVMISANRQLHSKFFVHFEMNEGAERVACARSRAFADPSRLGQTMSLRFRQK